MLHHRFFIHSFHTTTIKINRWILFAALSLLGGASHATSTTAPSESPQAQVAASSYAQGSIDGDNYAANLAATYGYGTPQYYDAIDARVTYAAYQGRNSEDPLYWRGYVNGVQDH